MLPGISSFWKNKSVLLSYTSLQMKMMKGSPLYSPKEKDTQCKCNTIKNLKKERAKPLFRKKDKQNVQVLHFDQQ
jgi:hypothetical protein